MKNKMSNDIEKARNMASGAYGAEIMKVISAVNWPIYIIDDINKKIFNGTCFCVDTGCGVFLLTAYHVFEHYVNILKSGVRCYIGSYLFDMNEYFIHENLELSKLYDIAVFRFQKNIIPLIKLDHDYYCIESWPPEKIQDGDGILFAGYPGVERDDISLQEVISGLVVGSAVAQRSSERSGGVNFFFDIDYNKLVDPLKLGVFPIPGYNMAGVSGSAIFKMKFGTITHWTLGGIFVQGISGQFNLFTGVDLTCLTPEGYLIGPA